LCVHCPVRNHGKNDEEFCRRRSRKPGRGRRIRRRGSPQWIVRGHLAAVRLLYVLVVVYESS
jgi:hypothetical protein